MTDMMISIFGCDWDERLLFERYAARYGVEVACAERPLELANIGSVPPGGQVSVNHKATVDARLIQALRKRGVSYLCSRSIGLDHVDRVAAERAGICVENVAYSPESVAEYTILLILMALRNTGSVLRRAGDWDFRLEPRRGRELRDMTVGIVGMGRIGQAVATRLSGFGCKILTFDRRYKAESACGALEDLLEQSDVVTLHLPLTGETRHLVNQARLGRMKKGAILINTARGGLVDSGALTDALERGHIACAALDVVEGEEGWFYQDCSGRAAPPFQRLLALPNAILTPHTAFYTEHALCDIVRNTIFNCMEHKGAMKKWIS